MLIARAIALRTFPSSTLSRYRSVLGASDGIRLWGPPIGEDIYYGPHLVLVRDVI